MTVASTELMSPDLVYNMIGVNAGADQRHLDEALKTAAANEATLLQAKATIEEQAKELSSIKARLMQVEAERNDSIATLNAAMQAKAAALQLIIDNLGNELAYQKRCVANLNSEVEVLKKWKPAGVIKKVRHVAIKRTS